MAIGIGSFICYDYSSWTDKDLESGISGYLVYEKVIPESIAHTEELSLQRAKDAGFERVGCNHVTTILKGRMTDR